MLRQSGLIMVTWFLFIFKHLSVQKNVPEYIRSRFTDLFVAKIGLLYGMKIQRETVFLFPPLIHSVMSKISMSSKSK